MRYNGMTLPLWLQDELLKRSPQPNADTLMELLLEDYIKRNAPEELPKPGDDDFFMRYAVDKKDGVLKFLIHDDNSVHIPSEETKAKYKAWVRRL